MAIKNRQTEPSLSAYYVFPIDDSDSTESFASMPRDYGHWQDQDHLYRVILITVDVCIRE